MGSPEVPGSNNDDVQQPPFNEGLILMDSDSEEEELLEDNDGYILLSQSAVDLYSDVVDDGSDSSGSEEYLDAESGSLPAIVPQDEGSSTVVHENGNSNVANSSDPSLNQTKPNFDVGTSAELRELWSASATHTDIDLGADKVQAVREAMSSITLPASAIPEWAASVPEEQWKQQILDRIQGLKIAK